MKIQSLNSLVIILRSGSNGTSSDVAYPLFSGQTTLLRLGRSLEYKTFCSSNLIVELPISEEEVENIRKLDTGNKK